MFDLTKEEVTSSQVPRDKPFTVTIRDHEGKTVYHSSVEQFACAFLEPEISPEDVGAKVMFLGKESVCGYLLKLMISNFNDMVKGNARDKG